jgi:hypothetical protein
MYMYTLRFIRFSILLTLAKVYELFGVTRLRLSFDLYGIVRARTWASYSTNSGYFYPGGSDQFEARNDYSYNCTMCSTNI